ncbi:MAG: queuosine precursor transporter [Chthoniobacterales bacterium]|nr:queuosine precursor transporter [Chthoniobacterales bacterium]
MSEQKRKPHYHCLPIIAMLYVTSLLIGNIAAFKIIQIGPVIFPAGLVIFPLSYIFDDILTEVYGYQYSRRIIWTGLFCIWLFCLVGKVTTILPAASFWTFQTAYALVIDSVPRLVLASSVGYLFSEFLNSYLLAKLKIACAGKHYWLRLLLSTGAGGAIDSFLFCLIAFGGALSSSNILRLVFWQWIIKVSYEILVIPLTYLLTGYLKRLEQEDYYDNKTNFNPFCWKIEDKD